MDTIIIVLLILLLNVFITFLLYTSDLCNKFLVYMPNVSASHLLDILVLLLNCLKEPLLVFLEFNNYYIRRKSFYNFLRNIFRSTQIAGKAHISKGFSKPIYRRLI
jgi:hypothetical protein